MARLSSETSETIWSLLRQLTIVVEDADEAKFTLFAGFGETSSTTPYLDELKGIALDAASRYSQSSIRLRIAEAQPTAPADMLRLLDRTITQNQLRIPALERSIQEIKIK